MKSVFTFVMCGNAVLASVCAVYSLGGEKICFVGTKRTNLMSRLVLKQLCLCRFLFNMGRRLCRAREYSMRNYESASNV